MGPIDDCDAALLHRLVYSLNDQPLYSVSSDQLLLGCN